MCVSIRDLTSVDLYQKRHLSWSRLGLFRPVKTQKSVLRSTKRRNLSVKPSTGFHQEINFVSQLNFKNKLPFKLTAGFKIG